MSARGMRPALEANLPCQSFDGAARTAPAVLAERAVSA
jgi:hypothetical protein